MSGRGTVAIGYRRVTIGWRLVMAMTISGFLDNAHSALVTSLLLLPINGARTWYNYNINKYRAAKTDDTIIMMCSTAVMTSSTVLGHLQMDACHAHPNVFSWQRYITQLRFFSRYHLPPIPSPPPPLSFTIPTLSVSRTKIKCIHTVKLILAVISKLSTDGFTFGLVWSYIDWPWP